MSEGRGAETNGSGGGLRKEAVCRSQLKNQRFFPPRGRWSEAGGGSESAGAGGIK